MRNCHMLLYQEAGCVLIHLPKERETIMKGYMFMFLCYFSVFHVYHYILQRLSTLIKKKYLCKMDELVELHYELHIPVSVLLFKGLVKN